MNDGICFERCNEEVGDAILGERRYMWCSECDKWMWSLRWCSWFFDVDDEVVVVDDEVNEESGGNYMWLI